MTTNFDKNLYSKENIEKMIFDKSLLIEYSKFVDNRLDKLLKLSVIFSIVLVGLPTLFVGFVSYGLFSNDMGEFIVAMIVIIVSGFLIFIVVVVLVMVFLNKVTGNIGTFKEYTEPYLLGYELALKRFEVENKIQDLEFSFNNKEFFHGLQVVQSLLKTRTMELENQIKMIPIEKQRAENEIFTAILERKLENEKQRDWLKDQMNGFEKL